jgi:multiple sugar transport system permease protein
LRSETLRGRSKASGPKASGGASAPALGLPRWFTSEHPVPWLFPIVAMFLAFGIYPLAYSLWLSLHKQNFFTRSMDFSGLLQWQAAFADPRMWSALGITLAYTAACLVIELVLGLAIALLLDVDRPGYGVLRALMTLPLVVPPAVTGLMFLLLEDNQYGVLSYYLGAIGVINPNKPILGTTSLALPGVMVTDIWQWTPFMVLIFHAALRALPREPFEAAAIDGAGAIAAFRHLTLPMLGKVIALAVLLRGIDLFRIYDYIYVMTSGGPGTATETISYYAGKVFGLANFPYAATLSIITLVVINLAALGFVRAARIRF